MTGIHSTPIDAQAILDERARQLARRVADRLATDSHVDALTFTLGGERFAIEVSLIAAVFRLTQLVPIPGATAPVVGVTHWRGDVLTLLDLRRIVGGSPTALDDLGQVIVLGAPSPEFGVLADSVTEIVSLDPANLHPPERGGAADGVLRGMTQDAVHIIDAAALIARQADAHVSSDAIHPPTVSSPPPSP